MRRSDSRGRVGVALAAFVIFGVFAPSAIFAQSALPPASIPGADQGDAAAMEVRIERLENALRAANGSIEELQNQQQRLQEQLKRFQEDVEFRFNGGNGPRPAAAAPAAPPAPVAAAPAPAAPPGDTFAARPAKRSDAFDPSTDPDAIGAPKQLGMTAPSAPLDQPPVAPGPPLDLSHPIAANATPTGPLAPNEPEVISGITGDGPRDQFNAAMDAYRAGQYDQAESQLRAFLAHNSGNRLVPDATFYLGESYLQRSRPREAAEQYLRLSTDYSKSSRAPEGMLRLGESLAMLGNNEQACATFGEVSRRYPTAASAVKKSVEREMQKDHC
ncbi:MAG TPA: tol-pal system protein YbgF [Roseiarcus sp.]|nr:tol-pal system protein YbgF [Roseiarcus sp.]